MQDELAVNYCKLAVVSTDPPEVTAAFRMGLGATFAFLSDHDRRAINALDMFTIDEVVISTLPKEHSRWLRLGLPQVMEQKHHLPVHHVEATPNQLRAWLSGRIDEGVLRPNPTSDQR